MRSKPKDIQAAAAALVFAVAAAGATAAVAAPAPLSLGFVKFNVNDLAAMQRFYEGAFGMQLKSRMEYPAFSEVILSNPGGADLALVKYKDGRVEKIGSANGPIGFYLKDVEAAYRQVVAAGGRSVFGPRKGDGFVVALAQDPEGHEIELLHKN